VIKHTSISTKLFTAYPPTYTLPALLSRSTVLTLGYIGQQKTEHACT